MSRRERRIGIVVLSLVGMAQALYMLAYRQRLIDSLACPLFGNGCEVVGRSRQSAHFGIPNAAVGVAAYVAMGLLALLNGSRLSGVAALPPLVLTAVAGSAVAASALLAIEQAFRVRAWCFWCLTSGLTNVAILLLSVADACPKIAPVLKLPCRPTGCRLCH